MKNEFNPQDAIKSGTLALCMPLLVALVIAIIASIFTISSSNSTLQIVVNVLTELSFLLVVLLVCWKNKTKFPAATKLYARPQKKYVGAAIFLGAICLLLFNPIISLWETLLSTMGYSISAELPYSLDNVGLVILALICVGLIPAFCEETLFRGTAQNGVSGFGPIKSIAYAALLFSLMHQNLQQLPYTFILGIVSGILLYYSRSLWPSIIFHFVNNGLVILLMALPNVADILFCWWIALDGVLFAQILISILCVLLACLIIFFMVKFFHKQNPTQAQALTQEKMFANKLMLMPIIVGILLLIISTITKFGVL